MTFCIKFSPKFNILPVYVKAKPLKKQQHPISKSLRLKKSSPLYDTACFKRNHIKQLCRPPLTILVHIKPQKGACGANKYSVPVSLSTIRYSIINCFKPCMHEVRSCTFSCENYTQFNFIKYLRSCNSGFNLDITCIKQI